MINISNHKKAIIYVILTIFAISFLIYFFNQTSGIESVEISDTLSSGRSNNSGLNSVNMDLDFFNSDKFKNLRFDKMPAVVFPVGKRDPFIPME